MSKKKKHEKTAKVAIKDQEEEVTETVMIKNEQTKSTSEEPGAKESAPTAVTDIDKELDDQEVERDPIISAAILVVVSILVSGIMISASILYVAVSGGIAINGGATGTDTLAQGGTEEMQSAEVTLLDDDPYIGGEDAQVVMIEFSDYECPFCQRYHLNTYPEIKSTYIDSDQIGYVWKDFPLSFHDPLATDQAVAAQCVMRLEGSEKYFEYADKIFNTTETGGNGMDESQLNDLAVEIGVDKADFDACADNDETLAKVEANIEAGAAAGISGTPGFVIGVLEDGVVKGEVVSGALPFANFQDVINSYLEEVE
jgi:protein-disulfide isomerase